MRLVTYVGLVMRRIWARRLMLLGSFLGATLVTALLVVLPLYEASVSAVDLLFTFRQAPDATLDLTAVSSSTEYTPEQANRSRAAIAEARTPIARWYPLVEERTLTREFVVIPLADPVAAAASDSPILDDWLGLAREWREALAAGQDPGSAPYPRPPREPTQTRFITSPGIVAGLEVIDGELVTDQDPAAATEPILRILIGENLQRLSGTNVGDRFVLRGFTSLPDWFEIVEVSGVARPVDPTDRMWEATNPADLIFLDPATFDHWMGTFVLSDPTIDPWLREERGFRRVGAGQTFILHIDREQVELGNVEQLARGVGGFAATVGRTEGIATLTRLPAIVAEFDVRTVVFGAPILAMLALIVAGALYFLIYMASLALERDAAELSLLRMRGASPWQTSGLHLMQSGTIALGAMLLAPVVARTMVGLTGRIPPMSTLTGGEALGVVAGRSIIPYALAGGILTFVSMGLAILPIARRSVLELRALATRPAHKSVWQRYHLDIFLVVLSGVILYELRSQGIVDTDASDIGLDPFSIAAPALFLFSGALVLLRVLPWLLRAIGFMLTRFRGLAAALPGWHLGRNPIPYGRLALLVWLTTGFGAFALTYADTLETSYADRAAFVAGADARIVGEGVGFLDVPEGTLASAVYRGVGAPRMSSRGAELIAVDPATFADVVAWRPDYGASHAADVFGSDTLGPAPDWGVELPEGTEALRVDGVLVPAFWRDRDRDGPADPVRVLVRVVDERSRYRVHAATTSFTDTGWATVEIPLDGASALGGIVPDAASLVVQAMWVERDAEAGPVLSAGRVLLDDWRAVVAGSEVELDDAIAAEFTGQAGMVVGPASGSEAADTYYRMIPDGATVPSPAAIAAGPLHRTGTVMAWAFPARNRAQPLPHLRGEASRVMFVLDGRAATVAGLSVGDETVFGVAGAQIPGSVGAIVALVPATGDSRLDGVLVARLDALLHWISIDPSWSFTGVIARVAQPQELWVATETPNDTLRDVLARYPSEPDAVLTAVGVSADFASRPIQVGLVSILFIGTGAGVVLALAGVTGYVLVAVRRRYREMGVLRALGFRRRGVAGTFAVEQLVVLGVGAVIGVGAGIGLMRLMIPFLQLGEGARDLVPPAVMVVSPARLGLYLSVVAGLLVISVLVSTRSVSARRLSEVLREVER